MVPLCWLLCGASINEIRRKMKTKIVMTNIAALSALAAIIGSQFATATAEMVVYASDNHAVTINRKIEQVTNPVTNTFTYQLHEDGSNPGLVTNLPTLSNISFDEARPDSSAKAVYQTMTVDFSNTVFPKLGEYKFILNETSSSDPANYPVDEGHVYYIYASVRNDLNANNAPTGKFRFSVAVQTRDHDTGEKCDFNFSSVAKRTYIQLFNNVTGNMAEKDKYFKYQVTIKGVNNGHEFVINGQDSNVTYDNSAITTGNRFVVGETTYIYLKHGQSATIGQYSDTLNQIPINATYDIVELGADDYTTRIDGGSEPSKTLTGKVAIEKNPNGVEDAAFYSSNVSVFVNSKDTSVSTGVFLDAQPYLVGIGICLSAAAIGVVFALKQRKTRQ